MTDVTYDGVLTGNDGSKIVVTAARYIAPPGPSGPSGPSGPTGSTGATGPNVGPITGQPHTVRIGAASYSLTAVNPTTTDFPGGRGPNQLVAYQTPVAITQTNLFGAEMPVIANVCGQINDRQTSTSQGGTPIPAGGYVLSAHGDARTWLLVNAKPGAAVQLLAVDLPTGPSGPSGPTGAVSTKTLAVYMMMWPGNGSVSDVPAQCNEIRLAFAQGSPPSLVGFGSDGQQQLVAKLAAFRARGGRVLISVGGSGGGANPGDHAAFLAGIANIRSALSGHVDGIDWDLEAVGMNTTDVVVIGTTLKTTYGPNFRIVFAPNGSNVGAYLPAAVACQRAGCLDFYAQQYYDANVSYGAALGRIQEAISAGIPASKVGVGMMIGPGSNYWSNATCLANYTQLKAAVPDLAGAYLWELHRDGTAQWASDLAPLVFGS